MVKSVLVKASDKQLSKLRNGHSVRLKPPTMEGEGCNLIVHPENYNLLSRSFSKNKGVQIQLTPEEIVENKEAAPAMEGSGIFGKKFDRRVKKVIGKKAAKELYSELGNYLPMAQAALIGGLTAGGTALSVAQPELIPFIAPGVAALSTMGSNYLANPSKYQGGKSSSLAKEYAKDVALQQLNGQLGTNMGNLSSAGIQKAIADKASSELISRSIQSRQQTDPFGGSGLYASYPSRTGGAVGLNGGFMKHLPPAMQSQPLSANFQFQATLPPAYQKFAKMGSGLYL
jgi:hypothetical protein